MHLMFQQYDERLQRREAKPNTLNNFRRTAALFEESGLDPMTAEDWQIEGWLAGLRASTPKGVPHQEGTPRGALGVAERTTVLSPRTIRLHFENLSAAYSYAVYRRQLERSPMEAVRLPREPDREPRILEGHELRHILGNCVTDQQHLLVTALMYTGMRRSEARCLKWEDISPTSLRVIGKGDKLRHIPLHPALSEVIVRQEPKSEYVFSGRGGKPMVDSTFFYILEKCRGAVHCTFHDFRRTVATSLAENEVPEGIIDRIMGWAPRTVGRRYYIRRADATMQEAILKLYANDPIA